MSAKHASGPWRTSDSGEWTANHDGLGSSCYQGIKDELGNVVALAVAHDPNHFSDPDTQANARLIAAAPCLLDALQELTQIASVLEATCLGDSRAKKNRMDRARAAIAKATGETK
jgi:hypothetical protein